jgi:hypothetical protein
MGQVPHQHYGSSRLNHESAGGLGIVCGTQSAHWHAAATRVEVTGKDLSRLPCASLAGMEYGRHLDSQGSSRL